MIRFKIGRTWEHHSQASGTASIKRFKNTFFGNFAQVKDTEDQDWRVKYCDKFRLGQIIQLQAE